MERAASCCSHSRRDPARNRLPQVPALGRPIPPARSSRRVSAPVGQRARSHLAPAGCCVNGPGLRIVAVTPARQDRRSVAEDDSSTVLTVADAAQRLGVDASRVRKMLRRGELPGQRHGHVWMVDAAAVARRAHRPSLAGRPLSPSRAWALLDLAEGGSAPWLTAQSRSQVRAQGRALRHATPQRLRAALRARSDRHGFIAHAAAVRRLVEDADVVVAGATEAARVGLNVAAVHAPTEVYVRGDRLPDLVRSLALRPTSRPAEVLIRVPRVIWPFTDGAAGPATLAADLLESDEPRAVTAGTEWLQARLARLDE